jgi:Putative endonuclease, protein of unknown function (DUF1780)
MTEDERRYIKQEITNLKNDKRLLSNAGKPERERLSCVMFLQALGVPFSLEHLIEVPNDGAPDYIDVKFGEVRFQVTEIVDENCRRQDDVEADIQQYTQGLIQDRPFTAIVGIHRPASRRPMEYREVYDRLHEALNKKASAPRYKEAIATLDALVLIQLNDRSLDPTSQIPAHTALRQQGWRSVSFVMQMCSHVVYATQAAPAFLQEYAGKTRHQWEDIETFGRL